MTPRQKHLNDIGIIALQHGFTAEEVISPCRSATLVKARQECIIMFRDRGYSVTEIGRIMRRDHTTIVHTLQRVQKLPEINRLKALKLPANAGVTAGLI